MNKLIFKERISRSLAVVLAFALILTNMDMTAFAATSQGTESKQKIITKVAELDSSVLSQTLTVGAGESDILFPESLTVTVMKEQDSETVTEPETEKETVPGTEQSEVTETEKTIAEQLFDWFAPMTVYAAELNENEENITVTWQLDESTSTSEVFDASKEGNIYVYIPVIPGEYTVAENVELPKITVTIGTDQERSEVMKALQTRINVLPTVDEFIAMADGTTAEGSTLNQAQLDVYNEAQAIAEEIDKLTDDEQGQLDTGKLEALFEYFNGMVGKSSDNDRYESIQISEASLNGNTVNGKGESGKYLDSDGGFYSSGYSSTYGYLPDDGKITTSDNVPYQLSWTGTDPYVGNDCIRIEGKKRGQSVYAESSTMTLLTYGAYSKVYVLGTAAGFQDSTNSLDFKVTLTYTDGTTSETTYKLYDWYAFYGQMDGYAQYRRHDGKTDGFGNPRLQSKAIDCDDTKLLKSITFDINARATVLNASGKIYAGIYAVTGVVSANAPESPTAVSATEVAGNSFTANWNEVSGATGYAIDVSEYEGFSDADGNPSFVGEYNNYSVSEGSTTSLKINGLDNNKTYYYRIRSINAAGQSINSSVISATTAGHTHSWQYEVNGNVIKAYCNGSPDTCDHQGEDKAVYLTLNLTGLDTNNSITYSGNAFDGASVENNITSVTEATAGDIKYKGRGETNYDESTTAPSNAGSYTAEVTIGGATATADFTIKKADITPTVSFADGVYVGRAFTPNLTGNLGNGNVIYYYKEQNADDSTYAEVTDFATIPVGSYTLKASIAESTNYNANEATCNFAVTRQPVTVNVSMDGWTYGDTANTPDITDGSNPGNGKVTYIYYTDAACTNKTTSADGAASDGAVPKNAGTYYVKATIDETDSYAAGSSTKEFTIDQKVIGIEWSGDNFTYNGKTQAPTAAATGLSDGDTCTITVTGGQKDTNVKAGNDKYTATADAVENTNYKLPTTGTTHEYTITPAELTVTWENTELTYNGTEQTPTAKLNGLMGGDACKVTVTGGQTDANVKTNTESYQATASIEDKNYELKGVTGVFRILPKSIKDAEVKLTPGDVIRDGSEVTQTVDSVTVDGVTLTASTDYEVADGSTFTANDFGIYTITLKGTGNYTDTVSAKWKIKDENPPTGEIVISENKWTSFWNGVTFSHFFKETQKVTINASDEESGVDMVYYYNSNEILSLDEVKALADGEWKTIKNGGSYNIDPENRYVVYVKIMDKSGNVTYISSEGLVIEKDNDNNNNDNNNNDNNNSNSNSNSDNSNGNNSKNGYSAAVPDNKKESQSVNSPKTGDDFNMALWTTLLMASAAGLATLFGRRKKDHNMKDY